MRYELEVGARTVDDVLAAERGGADRVELYASPLEGALTPSAGLIGEAVDAVKTVDVLVMVRPRAGDFVYSKREFATLQRDVDVALSLGVSGVMVGVLDAKSRLDIPRMERLARQCGAVPFTLHRAFDFTPDPFETLEQAIDLGSRFVLTMGQDRDASFPLAVRRELVKRAGARIGVQIALGADFDTADLPSVAKETGARHFHVVNGFRSRPSPPCPAGRPGPGSDYLRKTLPHVEYLCENAVREVRRVLDQQETHERKPLC